MNTRWTNKNLTYVNAIVVRWETKAAEYLQIELSPTHILRIKIDKK